ncbi:MAG TPA: hypothetical protein VN833_29775, partial [Candidatus Acidoferrales bacterium]|nr:hypothetical protein [Candidatus Acidoferrales bacterium]
LRPPVEASLASPVVTPPDRLSISAEMFLVVALARETRVKPDVVYPDRECNLMSGLLILALRCSERGQLS